MKILVFCYDPVREAIYQEAVSALKTELGGTEVSELSFVHPHHLGQVPLEEYCFIACEQVRTTAAENPGEKVLGALKLYYPGQEFHPIELSGARGPYCQLFSDWFVAALKVARSVPWSNEIWHAETFNRFLLHGPFNELAHARTGLWKGPIAGEEGRVALQDHDVLALRLAELKQVKDRWMDVHYAHLPEILPKVVDFYDQLDGELNTMRGQNLESVKDGLRQLRNSLVNFGATADGIAVKRSVQILKAFTGPNDSNVTLHCTRKKDSSVVWLPLSVFSEWREWINPKGKTKTDRATKQEVFWTATYVEGGRTGKLLVSACWYRGDGMAYPDPKGIQENLQGVFGSMAHWFGCVAYDSQQGWYYAKQIDAGVKIVRAQEPDMKSFDLKHLVGEIKGDLTVEVGPDFGTGSCQVFVMPVV